MDGKLRLEGGEMRWHASPDRHLDLLADSGQSFGAKPSDFRVSIFNFLVNILTRTENDADTCCHQHFLNEHVLCLSQVIKSLDLSPNHLSRCVNQQSYLPHQPFPSRVVAFLLSPRVVAAAMHYGFTGIRVFSLGISSRRRLDRTRVSPVWYTRTFGFS
jgi:hypothetical protein